ncbi:hypothetical protein L873DRAFT_1794591 [Choiromyces venosus 120613-1]|uniref:Endoplasmic reticulum junction formation protein lunapark n=1 Tax=Choiromyces venosus 120613-1 TaxID=1336337 RepID=A0A3N4J0L5_9PEZI|nr:hypothetical protein L873DRAFT_1794591 [Choiromyces venosus 120613-1]
MGLFWPFSRGDDNSPDSFERILSKLASQIQTQTAKLTSLRQRSRRFKGLFTLYGVIGYILYVVVIVLVVGWKEVGPVELSGATGGPVWYGALPCFTENCTNSTPLSSIWSVRKLFDLYYNYRIGNAEGALEELQTKQKDTIEKLKAATKYSTTQSIIEKYGGGSSPGPSSAADTDKKQQQQPGTPQGGSVNQQLRQRLQGQSGPHGPPQVAGPTAPATPQQIQQQLVQQQMMAQQRPGLPSPAQMQHQLHTGAKPGMPEISGRPNPNAPLLNLPQTQPSSQQLIQPEEVTSPKWYDRLLDVIVGEDETSAKNRYALICSNCRMVNGLAPPGTTSLADMEGWGCARCGTWNGSPPGQRRYAGSEREARRLTPDILDGGKKAKGRRASRSPSPNPENVRTTGGKAKKEQELQSSSEEEEDDTLEKEVKLEGDSGDEEVPKVSQPKTKRGKGREKA